MVVNWALKPIEQPYDPLAEPSLLSMTVGMVATLDSTITNSDTLTQSHGGIHINIITCVEEDAWFGIIRILWTFVDNTLSVFVRDHLACWSVRHSIPDISICVI